MSKPSRVTVKDPARVAHATRWLQRKTAMNARVLGRQLGVSNQILGQIASGKINTISRGVSSRLNRMYATVWEEMRDRDITVQFPDPWLTNLVYAEISKKIPLLTVLNGEDLWSIIRNIFEAGIRNMDCLQKGSKMKDVSISIQVTVSPKGRGSEVLLMSHDFFGLPFEPHGSDPAPETEERSDSADEEKSWRGFEISGEEKAQ